MIAGCTVSQLHAVLFPTQFGDDLCFFLAVEDLLPNQISAVNAANTISFGPMSVAKKNIHAPTYIMAATAVGLMNLSPLPRIMTKPLSRDRVIRTAT